MPQSVPQWQAAISQADEIYYGGAAGGGKSDLLLGLAVTAHLKSIIFRRELTQLSGPAGLIERSREIIGEDGRYNGQEHSWRDLPGDRSVEFGACQYDRDKHKYQGRPHDFIGFDELPEFLESQYRFLIGWLRTTVEGQRCRVVCAGNPPMHADGQWVLDYWAPWLSEHHPNPAVPGELRWFAIVDGKNVEVNSWEPFDHNGQLITPRSRTFIPARLGDNVYLSETDYGDVLNNLPEPLRTQLLYGDFTVSVQDDPWQVIPTEWIRSAQRRWKEREKPDAPMDALGVDVARGGDDQTVQAPRYGTWFAPLIKHDGRTTPDGEIVKALVLQTIIGNEQAIINIDIIGVGASGYDSLAYHEMADGQHVNVVGVDFRRATKMRDRSGMLGMKNIRAAAYWAMRESLDPAKGDDLALPDDPELMADLAAPRWRPTPSGVQIESKEEIKARIGRSPDCGDAVVLANYGTYGAWMTLLD